jgi:hypothetical protein
MPMDAAGLWLPPLIAFISAVVGALGAGRRVALATAAGAALLLAVVASTSHDPNVHAGAYIAGLIVGGVGLGALPSHFYWAVGRRLEKRPVVLALTWVALAFPLVLYVLFIGLWTAKLVACPPGAYECPV